MKSSTALKKARRKIAADQEQYVCCALQYSGGEDTEVYRNLQKLFGAPVGTLVSFWLKKHSRNFKEFREATHETNIPAKWAEYRAAMRDYRLRWIDWMIEGYKAKGD